MKITGVFLKYTYYAWGRGVSFIACNLQDNRKRDMLVCHILPQKSSTHWIVYNEQKLVWLTSLVAEESKLEVSVLIK